MQSGSRDAYSKMKFAAAAIVSLLTLAIYLPALKFGFVNWDDWIYLSSNEHIRRMDIEFLKWVFTNSYASNYHPLTIISYAVDYSLWGLGPAGYHLENIILHSVNTALVFTLTLRVVRLGSQERAGGSNGKFALGAALITAFLFGLHPVHVESVAWVSERKDVLFMFFSLISALFYLKYAGADRADAIRSRYYVASLVFFLLGLLSKPMAITLPAVFLILDFYPLGRLDGVKGARKAILEKVPFFFLSAASAFLTVWAQKDAITTGLLPLGTRLLIAVRAYSFYLYKMLLPSGLAPYYPNMGSNAGFSSFEYLAGILVFLALSAVCVATIKRRRYLSAAWLYYVITLLPVIGIIQVGGQAAADRYTYSPSLGPFMLAGASVSYLYITLAGRRAMTAMLTIVLLSASAVLCVLTVRQIGIWKDSETLWTREIEVYPVSFAYKNRADYYFQAGRYSAAIEDYSMAFTPGGEDAVAIEVHVKRGISYQKTGDYRRAVDDFTAAITKDQRNINAYNNRGNAYRGLGDYPSAIMDYERAMALDPYNAAVYYNLGAAYEAAGNEQEAIANMRRAAELGLTEAAEYMKARGL